MQPQYIITTICNQNTYFAPCRVLQTMYQRSLLPLSLLFHHIIYDGKLYYVGFCNSFLLKVIAAHVSGLMRFLVIPYDNSNQ